MKKLVGTVVLVVMVATGVAADGMWLPGDQLGWTPEIIIAARQGDVESIEEFLAAGVYIDVIDWFHGRTPLMAATQAGEGQAVWTLVRRGAKVDRVDPLGRSAVAYAAMHGFGDILQTLIDFGADVEVVDKSGKTPLMYAATCGDCDTICYLIDAGADSEAACDGLRPYDFAVASGNEEAAELLAQAEVR